MIESRLLALIESKTPVGGRARLDSDLFDELGFNSVMLLDLVLSIEKEFNIEFQEQEVSLENFASPARIVSLIGGHTAR